MIYLTRLNDTPIVINSELIETIECTPDTIITTTSGRKYIVKETIEEIIDKVIKYKQKIFLTGPKIEEKEKEGEGK